MSWIGNCNCNCHTGFTDTNPNGCYNCSMNHAGFNYYPVPEVPQQTNTNYHIEIIVKLNEVISILKDIRDNKNGRKRKRQNIRKTNRTKRN